MAGSGAGEAAGAVLAFKLGWLKLIAGGAALLGAFMMAAVLEPKTKREMFLRALVALAASGLFSASLMKMAANYLEIPLNSLDAVELIEFTLAVGGIVGACSWFALGAAGELLRRFRARPLETAKEVVDVVKGGGVHVPPSGDGVDP